MAQCNADMTQCVAILDDTAARVTAMRAVLREVLPRFEVVAIDNAPDFIDWLSDRVGWGGTDFARPRPGPDETAPAASGSIRRSGATPPT